ncbi:hypothetical protein VTO42DRAFT_5674 [Malbranchea cinnamomea]
MLGKRKREVAVVSRQTTKDEEPAFLPPAPDAHELLRKHFEAHFEPLDLPPIAKKSEPEESTAAPTEDGEDSDWDGISDKDNGAVEPEIVDYTTLNPEPSKDDEIEKIFRKEFMSAKPPTSVNNPKPKPRNKESDGEDDGTDAANLKNDLALQRLLKESHLLDSAYELNPTGKNRHRALDIRMQSLGSTTSLYKQKNMPMSHRKGIEAKAEYKEKKRRQEARENGIILEKPAPKKSNKNVRRERGIGGPAVGKFVGGTLKLSKRDVADILGPQSTANGKRERGRR